MEQEINEVLIRGFRYKVVEKIDDNGNISRWIKKDENLFNDTEYLPYVEEKINKRCWRVEISQGNSIKLKKITPFTHINIKLNETDAYSCYADNMDYAFHQAKDIIYKLDKLMDRLNLSSPLNFKLLIDRDIYFKELPSKVSFVDQSGDIFIAPDCKSEYSKNWWASVKFPSLKNTIVRRDGGRVNLIKVDILDERIIWFRNDRRDKIKKIMSE